MEALRPDEIRPLVVFHEALKLAGWIDVRADEEGITELKLEPWGTVIGRLVDEDGGARAKVDIHLRRATRLPGHDGCQGRFRIDGLVPGKPAKVWVSPNGWVLIGYDRQGSGAEAR